MKQTDAVISIQGLNKIYQSSSLFKKKEVTAISDLSLDIPKTGIFVLLGSNGFVHNRVFFALSNLSRSVLANLPCCPSLQVFQVSPLAP